MALKGENEGKPWYEWDKPLMMAEASALSNAKKRLGDEIGFYVFLQYEFISSGLRSRSMQTKAAWK